MIENMNTMTNNVDVRQHIIDTAQKIMSCKGFSAVGLNEILRTAGVPKGSFYHYFESKESFGVVLLDAYFTGYMAHLDAMLKQENLSAAERLVAYWTHWQETQTDEDVIAQPEEVEELQKLDGAEKETADESDGRVIPS